MSDIPNASGLKAGVSIALVGIFLLGVFLRIHQFTPIEGDGFDERMYGAYVTYLSAHGLQDYPTMVSGYLDHLRTSPIVLLPPTRVAFLLAATLWHKVFSVPPIAAVQAVSCAASILTLALSGLVAGRIGGWRAAFGVLALMAVAPTQVSIAHRAFIDGFFGLLVLLVIWAVWESLQNPARLRWAWLTGVALTLLILTKENAAFAYLGLGGVLALNRWARFGHVSQPLLLALFAAPVIGVSLLALCSGGFPILLALYWENVTRNYTLPYAILHQDGPWFRYFCDLVLVSPAVIFFAIGGAFLGIRRRGFSLYLILFLAISYILMANLRYGINLRFANMWDFPLRWMAMIPIILWTRKITPGRLRETFYYSVLALLCALEFSNYLDIFVHHQVYDPISVNLLKALDMIK